MFIGLTAEERIQVLTILSILILICGILYIVKIKFKDKIDKCNNKIIKKFFERL